MTVHANPPISWIGKPRSATEPTESPERVFRGWALSHSATHLPWRAVPGEIAEFSEKYL